MVGGVELMALAFRLAVEVDAALDRIGCPSAQGIEVAPEIEAAVAVVAGVVVLEAEIEAVAIGESEAKAAHQVYRPVVLQVGLGDVRQYLVATAVVGRAVLLVGDGQAAVEQVVAAADRLRRAQVVILVALEAAAGAKLGVEASVAADPFLVTMLMIPPVAPPPYTALAPDITSMRSMLNGSMESNCRLMPANCSATPRRSSPVRCVRAGSGRCWYDPGSRYPGRDQLSQRLLQRHAGLGLLVQCSRSITQTVPGNSLMLVGAREPITTICCSTGSAASAGAENEAKGTGKAPGSRARRDGAGHEEMSELLLF